jgi:hypothetical protein
MSLRAELGAFAQEPIADRTNGSYSPNQEGILKFQHQFSMYLSGESGQLP